MLKEEVEMKKWMISLAVVAGLTGCQTATEAKNAYSAGWGAASCDQIRRTFYAYEQDRQSAEAMAALATLLHLETGTAAGDSLESSDAFYVKARDTANIALAAQGCSTL